jgi:hypothetical protein
VAPDKLRRVEFRRALGGHVAATEFVIGRFFVLHG